MSDKKIMTAIRARLDPVAAVIQYGIAIILLGLLLLAVIRLAGLGALSALPKVDTTALAYACGLFWAITRAWS